MKKVEKVNNNQSESQFIRVFTNVRKNKDMNELDKLILSHIISFQMQGKSFYMTNKSLAKEYGTTIKRISDAVQRLKPYVSKQKRWIPNKEKGNVTVERTLIVKDLDYWVSKNEAKKTEEPKFHFSQLKTFKEATQWLKETFKNPDEIEAYLRANNDAMNYLDRLSNAS